MQTQLTDLAPSPTVYSVFTKGTSAKPTTTFRGTFMHAQQAKSCAEKQCIGAAGMWLFEAGSASYWLYQGDEIIGRVLMHPLGTPVELLVGTSQ